MKAEDYEVVKVIGRGAFGEVQLVSKPYFVCALLTLAVCENILSNSDLICVLFTGKTQSHMQSIRHEAAEQVWDDQEIGFSFLLGGAGHHGVRQQRMGGAGMTSQRKSISNLFHLV